MTEATSGLENKANAGVETMFGEFMTAFEEFKRTNDGRLAELEKRGSADVVTDGRRSCRAQRPLREWARVGTGSDGDPRGRASWRGERDQRWRRISA
jgi:hypothetical protein